MAKPLILSASPRRGNSYLAAKLTAEFLAGRPACSEPCQYGDQLSGQPEATGTGIAINTPVDAALPGFTETTWDAELLELRDYDVRPCIDCGVCFRACAVADLPEYPGVLCPLAGVSRQTARFSAQFVANSPAGQFLDQCSGQHPGQYSDLCSNQHLDQCDEIFRRFLGAPFVLLAAPIYFYHLPAQLKALLDRSQLFWQARLQGHKFTSAAPRNVWCILLGARERGEKLFEGSLLTLKYALEPFGLRLAEPLTLHGLEGPEDLAGSQKARRKVLDYAAKIAVVEERAAVSK